MINFYSFINAKSHLDLAIPFKSFCLGMPKSDQEVVVDQRVREVRKQGTENQKEETGIGKEIVRENVTVGIAGFVLKVYDCFLLNFFLGFKGKKEADPRKKIMIVLEN